MLATFTTSDTWSRNLLKATASPLMSFISKSKKLLINGQDRWFTGRRLYRSVRVIWPSCHTGGLGADHL